MNSSDDNDNGLIDIVDSHPSGTPCERCEHVFDLHIVVAWPGDGLRGVVQCPAEGCGCEVEWVMDSEDPEVQAFFRAQFRGRLGP